MSRHRFTARLFTAAGGVAAIGLLVLTTPGAALAEQGWELGAMSVPQAHQISRGEGVTVAVVDTGIRTDHPVLAERATEGPDFLKENDQSQPWYGAHGTSMASSVLDVAPDAKVLGLRAIRDREDPKFVAPSTGDAQRPAAADAVGMAIRHATDSGAKVISLSLGSEFTIGAFHADEMRSIDYALSKGSVVVAGMGNEGDDANPVAYPVAYPGVIGVAATKPDGSRASFSSVHSYADVAAPGVDIYGADHKTDGRKKVRGTSSATALTSGVVALIVAKYPDLSPRQVKEVLEKTASHPTRHDPKTGYGVINAAKALKAAAKLKPEPAILPAGKQGAGKHFGPGDDGTPRMTGQPLDTGFFVFGGVSGVLGLIVIAAGVLLFRAGRRAGKAPASAPATGGSHHPGGPPPPGPTQGWPQRPA